MKKSFKKNIVNFIQKMRFKYRISIVNENKSKVTWYTRLSRFSVLLFASSFFLFTFILITLLIIATPIRHYLPIHKDNNNRLTLIQQSLLVDSLKHQVELQENYTKTLKDIITNNNIGSEQNISLDTGKVREHTLKLIQKSQDEQAFVEAYEETEKYNLASIPTKPTENALVFFRPVSGVIASQFLPRESKFGISIITSPRETVKSVLEGTIVFAEYTFDNQWVIQVQHNNGYISVYKNNTKILKNIGEKVSAGESIAITGADEIEKKTRKYLYFELWKNGIPIDPQDVITFRF